MTRLKKECRDAEATRFIEATKDLLGIKAKGRRVLAEDGSYEVRELGAPYRRDLGPKNRSLKLSNTYYWNDYPDILIRQHGPTRTGSYYRVEELSRFLSNNDLPLWFFYNLTNDSRCLHPALLEPFK